MRIYDRFLPGSRLSHKSEVGSIVYVARNDADNIQVIEEVDENVTDII